MVGKPKSRLNQTIVSLLVISLLTINIIVAIPITTLAQGAAAGDVLRKVDPNVLEDLSDDGKAKFVVILSQPDWGIVDLKRAVGGREAVISYLKTFSTNSQTDVIKIIKETGGNVLRTFWIMNAILAIGNRRTVVELASLPNVDKIIPNFKVHLIPPVKTNEVRSKQSVESWGIGKIRAPEAWTQGYTGAGIRIAVLDTGVDISHPALQGKMFTVDPGDPYYPGGWMEFDEDGNPVCSAPHDTHGHGTHVSGTALGGDTTDILIGVAPDAQLMHGLVIPYGSGTFAQVLAGIEWAVDPYDCEGNPTGYPAHVISMSLGASSYYGNDLLPAIKAALEANVIVVAAIGNDGEGTSSNPGNVWGVFGVGATDENDNVAYFSSGEVVNWPSPPEEWPFYDVYPSTYIKPDVSAPGVDITSAVPGGGYEAWSGTSMATPHVTGTVALILQAAQWTDFSQPDLPEKVYEILNSTAIDLGDPGQDIRYGYGRIDAYEAVMKAKQYAKPTGVEGYVYDEVSNEPVTWASVTVIETGETVQVDANGYFKIPLDPGTYTLMIEAWGYVTHNITVEVTAGNGTVAGTVTDYVTGDPIEGAEVTVTNGTYTWTTYTNSSGEYAVSVPPGTYEVTASAPGYVNETVSDVSVGMDEVVIVNFVLIKVSDLGTIYGYVKDSETGNPISGATVLIAETGDSSVTDQSGYYEFRELYPGNYTLVFSASGYQEQEIPVELGPGEEVEINATLTPITQPDIYAAVVGNVDYYTEPHLADIVAEVTGLQVLKYDNVSQIIPDLQNGVNFAVIIVDHFSGPDTGVEPDKDARGSLPGIQTAEVLLFLNLTKEKSIPVIFLGTPYSGYTALLTLYENNDVFEFYGYPAPDSRGYGWPSPEYVKVYVPAGLASSPIFDGVVWDGEEGAFKWFYLANVSDSWYADYDAYNFTDDPGVVPVAFVNDTYNGRIGIGIAFWEVDNGTYWYYLGSWGESYWMQYIEPGSDGVYSNNTLKVLKNVIYLAASGQSPLSLKSLTGNRLAMPETPGMRGVGVGAKGYTYLEIYLEREPYGYIEGYVYDAEGNPLEGAKVIIEGAPFTLVTDAEGHFSHWLPTGTYEVNITKEGFATYTTTVTITEGETSSLEVNLNKLIWIAVMYDYMSQIKNLIESRIEGVYVWDFNNWTQFYDEVLTGEYDVVIFAGYYYAEKPDSPELFLDIIYYLNSTGKGVMFLDNWCGTNDWAYGIKMLVDYVGDPNFRDDGWGDGYVYLVIQQTHPIFEGYEIGQTVYIVADIYADYAWFEGFSGDVLASIGADDVGVVGSGVGVKVFPTGSRWVLMSALAPEQWTPMTYWTEDAKQIFTNAVKWLLTMRLNVTLEPNTAKVGEEVTVYIADGEPGLEVEVTLDGSLLGTVTLDQDGSGELTFQVPEMPAGTYIVEAFGSNAASYYGSAYLTVITSLSVSPTTVAHAEKFTATVKGADPSTKLYLFIDGNFLSFFITNNNGSATVEINLPYYFGEGTHTVNIVKESGEVIASATINVVKGELYEYIDSEISEVNSQINSTNNKLNAIDSDIQEISGKLSTIEAIVEGLQAKITTSTNEVKQAIRSSKADIIAVVQSAKGDILVAINTSTGTILTPISTLKDAIGQDLESINSLIEVLNATMNARISALDDVMKEGFQNILGEITKVVKDESGNIIATMNARISALDDVMKEGFQNILGEITKVVKDESGNIIATIKTSEGTIVANITGLINDVKGLIETKAGDTYALIDTKLGTVITNMDNLKELLNGQSQKLTEISDQLSTQIDESSQVKSKVEAAINSANIAAVAAVASLIAALGSIVLRRK